MWLSLWLACGPGQLQVEETSGGTTATTSSESTTATSETGTTPTSGTTGTSPTTAPEAADYRLRGPYAVTRRDGNTQTSCGMAWSSFQPNGHDPLALVVLSHGWQRSKAQVEGWADHWASWGLAVLTPNLCHANILDTDHEQNGLDLIAVAAAFDTGLPIVYVGHSAGGLGTFLAASQDSLAIAHLGLDLVDNADLAVTAADPLAIPAYGLIGEPDACNEDNNALDVYAAVQGGVLVRVLGADHCDFESPTDWGCTTFCGDGGADDDLVHGTILGLSTAFVLWQSGEAPEAEQWWTAGYPYYDSLVDGGLIRGG